MEGPVLMDAQTLLDIGNPNVIGVGMFFHESAAAVIPLAVRDVDVDIVAMITGSGIMFISTSADAAATIYGSVGLRTMVLAFAQFGNPFFGRVTVKAGIQTWLSVDGAANMLVNLTYQRQS